MLLNRPLLSLATTLLRCKLQRLRNSAVATDLHKVLGSAREACDKQLATFERELQQATTKAMQQVSEEMKRQSDSALRVRSLEDYTAALARARAEHAAAEAAAEATDLAAARTLRHASKHVPRSPSSPPAPSDAESGGGDA